VAVDNQSKTLRTWYSLHPSKIADMLLEQCFSGSTVNDQIFKSLFIDAIFKGGGSTGNLSSEKTVPSAASDLGKPRTQESFIDEINQATTNPEPDGLEAEYRKIIQDHLDTPFTLDVEVAERTGAEDQGGTDRSPAHPDTREGHGSRPPKEESTEKEGIIEMAENAGNPQEDTDFIVELFLEVASVLYDNAWALAFTDYDADMMKDRKEVYRNFSTVQEASKSVKALLEYVRKLSQFFDAYPMTNFSTWEFYRIKEEGNEDEFQHLYGCWRILERPQESYDVNTILSFPVPFDILKKLGSKTPEKIYELVLREIYEELDELFKEDREPLRDSSKYVLREAIRGGATYYKVAEIARELADIAEIPLLKNFSGHWSNPKVAALLYVYLKVDKTWLFNGEPVSAFAKSSLEQLGFFRGYLGRLGETQIVPFFDNFLNAEGFIEALYDNPIASGRNLSMLIGALPMAENVFPPLKSEEISEASQVKNLAQFCVAQFIERGADADYVWALHDLYLQLPYYQHGRDCPAEIRRYWGTLPRDFIHFYDYNTIVVWVTAKALMFALTKGGLFDELKYTPIGDYLDKVLGLHGPGPFQCKDPREAFKELRLEEQRGRLFGLAVHTALDLHFKYISVGELDLNGDTTFMAHFDNANLTFAATLEAPVYNTTPTGFKVFPGDRPQAIIKEFELAVVDGDKRRKTVGGVWPIDFDNFNSPRTLEVKVTIHGPSLRGWEGFKLACESSEGLIENQKIYARTIDGWQSEKWRGEFPTGSSSFQRYFDSRGFSIFYATRGSGPIQKAFNNQSLEIGARDSKGHLETGETVIVDFIKNEVKFTANIDETNWFSEHQSWPGTDAAKEEGVGDELAFCFQFGNDYSRIVLPEGEFGDLKFQMISQAEDFAKKGYSIVTSREPSALGYTLVQDKNEKHKKWIRVDDEGKIEEFER
jgi:hypothetical protein